MEITDATRLNRRGIIVQPNETQIVRKVLSPPTTHTLHPILSLHFSLYELSVTLSKQITSPSSLYYTCACQYRVGKRLLYHPEQSINMSVDSPPEFLKSS